MAKRFFVSDDGVTEVIGYVLSFALSAVFLLLALNVFWAARGNTEAVTTGVELKTIADRVAAHVVQIGGASQEFENARMRVQVRIPQMLNGQTYTLEAGPSAVTATTRDLALSASSTTFKTDVLGVIISGEADSSNELAILDYYTDGSGAHIKLSGG